MLLADDGIQPRVSHSEPVQRSFTSESRADQHNVVKLAIEQELVHEKLSALPEFVGPTINALNGMLPGSISILHIF